MWKLFIFRALFDISAIGGDDDDDELFYSKIPIGAVSMSTFKLS